MKYKYVRAWGKLLGSYGYYVDNQVEEAIKDHAPETAVFKRGDGTWMTVENLAHPWTSDTLERIIDQFGYDK